MKNPLHSLRISLLTEIFPKVKFIHIHRHPYQVVPSTVHLWKVMARNNQLKGKKYFPTVEEVAAGLDKFYTVIEKDLQAIPAGRRTEVSYEKLVGDPLSEIKRIYLELGLEYSGEFERSLLTFLNLNRDFKKNSYTFGDEDKAIVFNRMKRHFDHYHYIP